MPAQFTKGPSGRLVPKPGTTLNGKGAPTSSADTAPASRGTGTGGYDELGMGASSKYRGKSSPTSRSGAKGSPGELLRFPVDNIQAYPAYIKFEPYKVDAYEIDEQSISDLFDAPMATKYLKAVAGQPNPSEADKKVTSGGYDDGALNMMNENAVADRVPSADDEEGGAFAADPQFQAKNEAIRGAALREKFEADAAAKKKAERDARLGRYKTNMLAKSAFDDGSDIITLYLPQSLIYADNVAYRDVQLGQRGLVGLSGVQQGNTIAGSLASSVNQGLADVFKIFTGGLPEQGGELLAARLINSIPGGDGLQAAASTALQTGLNPGTRILFDKPNLREFTFNFKMIPRSPGEAEQIEKIVQSFREEMYPEALTVAGVPLGFKFPNVFYISMGIAGADIKLPQIQYAYLRNVTTTYNSTAGVFMEDGHPNEVDISLTFMEYRPLTKQDVQDGY